MVRRLARFALAARSALVLLIAVRHGLAQSAGSVPVTAPLRPPSVEPSVDVSARATELTARGVAERRAGREEEALRLFLAAYELEHSAERRAHMGLAAKSLGEYVSAEVYLTDALKAANDPFVRRHREVLEAGLQFVAARLATLEVELDQLGQLRVDDGPPVPLPLRGPLRVLAGPLRVEVRVSGFVPYAAALQLERRERKVLRPRLVRVAEGPPLLAPTSPGPAPSSLDPRRVAGVVTGATGLAVLGAGAFFAVRASSLKSERDELCPDVSCSSRRGIDLDDDAREAARYSTVATVVGVTLAGAGGYLLFAAPRGARPRAHQLMLQLGLVSTLSWQH